MSSNTTNLQLYKANPVTNPTDTFNIDTILNDNWDKIDQAFPGKANIPVANSKDLIINSINPQVIATYTPVTNGNFEIKAYLRVLSAVNITLLVTYTDVTGSQSKAMINEKCGLYFPTESGIQSYNAGSYPLIPIFLNAKAGTSITLTATASIANQVYISSSIQGV